MNNKKRLGVGIIILMITLGAFLVTLGLNFSDEDVIWLTGKPPDISRWFGMEQMIGVKWWLLGSISIG